MYKKSHSLHQYTTWDPGSKLKLCDFETLHQGPQMKAIVEKAQKLENRNLGIKNPSPYTIFDRGSLLTLYPFMMEFIVPRTEIRILFQPSS